MGHHHQVRDLTTGDEQHQEQEAGEQAAHGEHLAERQRQRAQLGQRVRRAETDAADDEAGDAAAIGR